MRRHRLSQRVLALASLAWATGICIPWSPARAEDRASADSQAIEFFERRIRPVLAEHCYECHSAQSEILQGGLRVDFAQGLLDGGDSGPAIDVGDAESSLLLSALKYESYEMPPKGPLPDAVVEDFSRWLAMGAPDPRTANDLDEGPPEAEQIGATDLWSLQAIDAPAPPELNESNWPRTPIDRFVLVKLQDAGVEPSPQAEARQLLRRVYYDLTGLPPTAEQLDEFQTEPTDEAYATAVDQLLASPRFGERWGRHWLDVARYADTKGYVFQEDRAYPGAYRYRDWVIDSFNNDLPYDRFVIAQLAADQMNAPELLPGMGFLTLGRRFLNNRHDIIDDRIDVVSRGFMGLTVACARCHDHKYDPIPTADYYSLYGVFASSNEQPQDEAPALLVDAEQPADAAILLRGSPSSPGPVVPRRFLSCLSSVDDGAFQTGSGRLELAHAVASAANPLTPRVWVNRVWAHLFGRGIVATTSDFGARGEPPTHPQLLDWLARDFTDHQWSTKRLIRQLVLSSVYRQSSSVRSECAAVDPENSLWWRANRRRLDLESLRDSLLFAAGQLDETRGGPSVSLTEAPFSKRRSVYGYIERQNLPAFFRTFDFASPNAHTPKRPQTVSPQQALFFMNSPFAMQQAAALSRRSNAAAMAAPADHDDSSESDPTGPERRDRIERLFRLALGRTPSADEVRQVSQFFNEKTASAVGMDDVSQDPWRFGWGTWDEASGQIEFHPFVHFEGEQWRGGKALPDADIGWALLSAAGGHPGDAQHMVIRRFIVPRAGLLSIEGRLRHASDQGDGVRGRVFASGQGPLEQWVADHREVETAIQAVAVESGDAIDLVVDCRESESHDSFQWEVNLEIVSPSEVDADPEKPGASAPTPRRWNSVRGFRGPSPPPLKRWEQLAQVLLMSNEFAFVD